MDLPAGLPATPPATPASDAAAIMSSGESFSVPPVKEKKQDSERRGNRSVVEYGLKETGEGEDSNDRFLIIGGGGGFYRKRVSGIPITQTSLQSSHITSSSVQSSHLQPKEERKKRGKDRMKRALTQRPELVLEVLVRAEPSDGVRHLTQD